MLLLDAMTSHLGQLDSWPTYILQFLFIDHPSPVRSKKLKRVMAFFYGNDVPLELACTFYNACNGTAPRFVVEQSRQWYCVWQSSRYERHMADYYSMISKKFININGSLLNQLELVLPEVTTMDFGNDSTTHPQLIRRKLEEIRMIEV